MSPPRRTQAQRRNATIIRLVDATIEVLADVGYGSTSISRICKMAGLSQGALFRQFDSRIGLIARATETIGQRHLEAFTTSLDTDASPQKIVEVIRDLCRSRNHSAWHEVMVAARTDPSLHDVVVGVLTRFETSILELVQAVAPVSPERGERVGALVLSIMHMFDSEAVTVLVKPSPAIEAARLAWATEVLGAELEAFA